KPRPPRVPPSTAPEGRSRISSGLPEGYVAEASGRPAVSGNNSPRIVARTDRVAGDTHVLIGVRGYVKIASGRIELISAGRRRPTYGRIEVHRAGASRGYRHVAGYVVDFPLRRDFAEAARGRGRIQPLAPSD